MKNVETSVDKNILTIKVDLTKTFGKSSSGKSIIIASSEGNQVVAPEIYLGINVYKKDK
jgi:hypothetical protein